MTDIIFFINTLNGREKAVIVWFLIFLFWALSQKNIRTSMLGVLKAFFQKKIITVFLAMFVYIFFIILLFSKLQIWNASLTKDTGFWILGSAFVLLMNVNNATQDDHHFKKILIDNLKLILVLEFIITLYSFDFWIEMLFVPVMFLIVAMGAVAEIKKEYLPVKKLIDNILSFIGIFLIIFAISKVIGDYQGFLTANNLRSFVLPPLMTLAYIPFLYIFALIMAYEMLFVRLDIFLKNDKKLAGFAKQKIFRLCFLNLGKLNRFAKESTSDLLNLRDKNGILNLVERFNK